MFCGRLKHIKAELEIPDNDSENPLPFVSGLPVGIPFKITLYNVLREKRLWLRMAADEELTRFIFLDLNQFGGCDEVRKFTYIAPFYGTPKVFSFTLRVSIGMEGSYEDVHMVKGCGGPKHELTHLCQDVEVYLSMGAKD
ncbi:hypothetical protein L1049_008352 [Liquidambar formosana]|uniref:Integrator complex subunit 4/Protein SIEL C-terminal Ig-like domain-containing protein n=1 Tax=Liquidambar formosana TaxID=63359 RepID=A0AAP0X4I4_LIQFO